MPSAPNNEAMDRFFDRVWKENVAPLLNDRLASHRRVTARAGGRAAGLAGSLLDRVFGLSGKPFTRSMTIVGARLGAILPDAWNWDWLHDVKDEPTRRRLRETVAACAAALPEAEALALFGLTARSSQDELKAAWRALCKRLHPDLAASPESKTRREWRFIAYRGAYELLIAAYESGRLPLRG